MATGAGGSIGKELCRQAGHTGRAALWLILFDHSGHALYAIEQELRQRYPGTCRITARIGSVGDAFSNSPHALRGQEVDTIYHAAAYKHVPLVEGNMSEGIRNNASRIVRRCQPCRPLRRPDLRVLHLHGQQAVRPTNVMGASASV
ncbi:polysaccharide biosynthesis protein [Cupriavidus basilensis]